MLKAKYRGALLGATVGDALGAPFEGLSLIDDSVLIKLEQEPGELVYTDDTHMMLGLAESLVQCRSFDGEHMANLFARNYMAEPWRGYGAGPPRVFRLIRQGVPWYKASSILFGGTGSFGNGAAMRAAPAGLIKYSDLEVTARIAGQSAIITHSHTLGVEGAVLQACAVALLVQQPAATKFDPAAFINALKQQARTPEFQTKLEKICELLPNAGREEVIAGLGNGIQATQAVPAALYAFLRHPDSFSGAVTYAISLGGDTDTIACMTGALAGAFLGEQAIPTLWRSKVEGAERLRELADALLSLAESKEA